MDTMIYTALTRQSGLKTEMDIIANNLANASTTGFRAEGLVFSEYISQQSRTRGSVSMTDIGARIIDSSQGALRQTNATFDIAIEGDGYFQLAGPDGAMLSRAGAFSRNENGELASPHGWPLLDEGGAPIFVPPNAKDIAVASDGTLSVDSAPISVIGLVQPVNPERMERIGNTAFRPNGDVEPAVDATLHQGFLETSNVNPLAEVARMIEVQRRYEAAKSFVDREHDRIKSVIDTLGR
jgi:flagellar basal-body rod protein FlgF